jgi:hypothetical protein
MTNLRLLAFSATSLLLSCAVGAEDTSVMNEDSAAFPSSDSQAETSQQQDGTADSALAPDSGTDDAQDGPSDASIDQVDDLSLDQLADQTLDQTSDSVADSLSDPPLDQVADHAPDVDSGFCTGQSDGAVCGAANACADDSV